MWLETLDCACDRPTLNGLGFVEYIAAGTALLTAANKGGGGGAPTAPSIAPGTAIDVSTQVSPQISPSFVQQDNPTNSPVTTGATQYAPMSVNPLPYTPATGIIPGFDAGGPGGMSPIGAGYLYPNVSQTQGGFLSRITPTQWAMLAGGVVLAAVAFKKRERVKHYARAGYERARRAVKAF